MKFYLLTAKGKKKGTPIAINIDLFLFGSDPVCQLRSTSLGPKHCALLTREKKVFVQDLDSGKPTLVNGNVILPGQEWPLHSGDRLEAGKLEFIVELREKSLSQKDMEEWALRSLDQASQKIIPGSSDSGDFQFPVDAAQAAASIINKMHVFRGQVVGRLRIAMTNGITVVRFNDSNLVDDSEIAMIKKELCDNLNRPNLRVLLDCKNIQRMSTAAATMMGELFTWLKPWGSCMALCRVKTEVQGILTVLKMVRIPVFADKQAALTSRW